ncbi:PIN domain-containing protein [Nitrosovibrio sp. Nv17]|uniref:PIN domain-containing protein n=1 Tax=Nitrosovibrio sp. Nv17 TaxID=1855339 RepID=UPI00090887C5|nr:PIN domain-containing protein [Nitrosovibrio sp. Nv17]SFW26650.1 Predicted nucleic acid-binding protein, contains PIN domain [Nitrosovibrio sp. Nv17]
MKVALDTNILAYAEGVNGIGKRDLALELVRSLPQGAVIIPVQVLGELFNVLTRKAGRSRADAREVILEWRDAFSVIETTPEAMLAAADLATDHHFGIWDAVILSVASQAGCRLLLSEDLQDGFTWGGVTVVNPIASPGHALLGRLLGRDDARHGPGEQPSRPVPE